MSAAVSPAAMVAENDRIRKAWLDCERYAHQLTGLAGTLETAAQLAGVRVRDDGARLGLTVDPHDTHRRRCWEAWSNTGGRCGRWSQLIALGATIRAWPADKLGEYTPYREPAPLEVRFRPAPYPHSAEEYTYDPEDHPGEPAPEPVKPRIRQLAP